MSDFIPTTEQVRETYSALRKTDAADAEFDRWLAAHDAELRAQIAAEIEARQWVVASTHHFGFGEHGWRCLCGFKSPVKRQRTEHIIAEIAATRIARGEQL